eukprot:983871_1
MKRSSTTTIAVILMYLQIISYSAAVMDEKDDPQKDIYYWKKKALEYKKEKLQYKKEKLQYKKETLQYRYQKESMEQKKENHKLKAREAMSKQSTDGYAELLRDFANTSESNAGDMSSTSTSANELYPSSSVSSTQSGPEDTTLDDPQKDIYYWKKKALEYKKEKLQFYKKEKLQWRTVWVYFDHSDASGFSKYTALSRKLLLSVGSSYEGFANKLDWGDSGLYWNGIGIFRCYILVFSLETIVEGSRYT